LEVMRFLVTGMFLTFATSMPVIADDFETANEITSNCSAIGEFWIMSTFHSRQNVAKVLRNLEPYAISHNIKSIRHSRTQLDEIAGAFVAGSGDNIFKLWELCQRVGNEFNANPHTH